MPFQLVIHQLADVSHFNDLPTVEWPYFIAIRRLSLALALGLFVGLERERRGKEAGVRTFAFAAMLGCLGALLGEIPSIVAIASLSILVAFLNAESMLTRQRAELTTSAALLVMGFAGVLAGYGHTLTPTAVAVLTAALLTWKGSLTGLSLGLTEAEVRSAILLAILAFVIYPALPEGTVDPWGLIEPRAAWVTVLLIAGIGFGNYILLKLYGNRAVDLTAFFGGLVNSTVTVTALASRAHEQSSLKGSLLRGVILATAAMLVRNAVLLGILSPPSLVVAAPALAMMLLVSLGMILLESRTKTPAEAEGPRIELDSPFALSSALKFGLLFLVIGAMGTLAKSWLGRLGFFAVSLAGGFVSSASSVAAAGTLAHNGTVLEGEAGIGAIIASLASTLIDLPLVARFASDRALVKRVAMALGLIASAGAAGVLVEIIYPRLLPTLFHLFGTGAQSGHSP
jgi:uncharacterized membrane protein (DUF4010 family)